MTLDRDNLRNELASDIAAVAEWVDGTPDVSRHWVLRDRGLSDPEGVKPARLASAGSARAASASRRDRGALDPASARW